jgi:hypothetical protein
MGIAVVIGICSREAASSPPLSSSTGIIEIIKTTISLDTYCPSEEVNHCTIESIYIYP